MYQNIANNPINIQVNSINPNTLNIMELLTLKPKKIICMWTWQQLGERTIDVL